MSGGAWTNDPAAGVNHVVEADVKSFFDRVNHEWMVKFLRHRIGDERVIRLISRMLKSGLMEDGLVRATEEVTPQGSILSPLLSNIYLHYVLDLWFSRRVSRQVVVKRIIFGLQTIFWPAFSTRAMQDFQRRLEDRLEGFGLELAKEKTRCIEFGRFAREDAYKRGEKPAEFTFLGFTHYCGKTQKGYLKVKRRTSRKKLGAESAQVHRLGKESQACAEERGDAQTSQNTRDRAFELLRHNGQLGKEQLLCLSHKTYLV